MRRAIDAGVETPDDRHVDTDTRDFPIQMLFQGIEPGHGQLPRCRPLRKAVDLQSKVYVTGKTGDGTEDLWADFEAGDSAPGSLLGFFNAVFRSAQNWHDNSYLKLPGYRDRVVEIWLTKEEGGLNLSMPQHLVEGLITRGESAGRMIRDRFTETSPEEALSWDGHRWIRLRSGMSGSRPRLASLRIGLDGRPQNLARGLSRQVRWHLQCGGA